VSENLGTQADHPKERWEGHHMIDRLWLELDADADADT